MLLSKHPPLTLQGGEIEHLCLLIVALPMQHYPQVVRDVVRDSLLWQRNLGHLPKSPPLRDPLVTPWNLTCKHIGRTDRLDAALPQQVHEPVLCPSEQSLAPSCLQPHLRLPQCQNPVEHLLLGHPLARFVRLLQQRQQAPPRLEMQSLVVEALVPAGQLCQRLQLLLVLVAPEDHEDAGRDAVDAPLPLKPNVAELLKQRTVALKAFLVASEDPVEVNAEVHAEAEEVLLGLLAKLEPPVQLALLLVNWPILPLTLNRIVARDEALPTTLAHATHLATANTRTKGGRRRRKDGRLPRVG